ncbi:MAG: SsrA-binding protein SmpB [gamma proteobacterium symbiont of Taylorina sp.]|nr:SsrA-binding protein SmpB [gamma proteobacterium symbiont of Taylorina sp.]
MGKKKKKAPSNTIATNKKARHDYHLENEFEAGLVLEGWEVKSIRAGKAQIRDAYILLKNGEAFLFGAIISPLLSASTHIHPEQQRSRKLLLHAYELSRLIGAVERKGYTIVPLSLYWKKSHVKCKIALAKGKQQFDKRASEKERDWNREKARIAKLT